MSIGSKIFELRTAKHLSQGDLSDMLDVSRQSVSKWETDSAIPDLDKLMKLCDVFGVTLDELTERTDSDNIERNNIEVRSLPTLTQKVIGYILFGLSFLVGLLLLFRGTNGRDFLVLIPFSLSLFICSMICFFLKHRALYYCIWTALAPMTILTPHIIGFEALSVFGTIQICCIVVMAFVAFLFFKNVFVSVSRKKGIILIIMWIATITLYVLNFSITSAYWLLSFMFNFVLFTLIAGLETYTVCYIQSLKH